MNPQKGGVSLSIGQPTNEESYLSNFIDFLNNSSLYYISGGSIGSIYKASITKSGYVSPYRHMSSNNFMEPITSIIVKFILNNNASTPIEDEVNIQTEVFLKTVDYLKPLCPAIIHAVKVDTIEKHTTFQSIVNNNIIGDEKQNILYSMNEIKKQFETPNANANKYGGFQSLDIIAMDFVDAEPMSKYKKNKKKSNKDYHDFLKYSSMAIYAILEMTIKTQYSHGDFHSNNIMIDIHEDDYFADVNKTNDEIIPIHGRAIIIDFGQAVKIEADVYSVIMDFIKNKKYINALHALCNINRRDGVALYGDVYKWLCDFEGVNTKMSEIKALNKKKQHNLLSNDSNDLISLKMEYNKILNSVLYVNNLVDVLFTSRQTAITALTKYYETQHVLNPQKYPQLPLSGEFKRQLYMYCGMGVDVCGIHGGALRRRKKILHKKNGITNKRKYIVTHKKSTNKKNKKQNNKNKRTRHRKKKHTNI